MEGSRTSDCPVINAEPEEYPEPVGQTVDLTQELSRVSSILSSNYKYASYDSYQALKKYYYHRPAMSDSGYQFLVQKTLEECTGYCTCHIIFDGHGQASLAEILIPYEQALSNKILSVASEFDFYERDIAKAILIILINNRMDEIINHISYLKSILESRLE